MKYFAVLILMVVVSTTTFAAPPIPSPCIAVADYDVECLGYDNQGLMRYQVSFTLTDVRPGASFIRIHHGGAQGSTYSYPFKTAQQSVVVRSGVWCDWETVVIDVYNVQPNGKVTRCTIYTSVYLCCEGYYPALRKDVVAGEPIESVISDLTIAPNPATDHIGLSVTVPSDDPSADIEIVDLNGNVVASVAKGLSEGSTVLSADTYNLPSGTYIVRLRHSQGIVVQKLQIVR